MGVVEWLMVERFGFGDTNLNSRLFHEIAASGVRSNYLSSKVYDGLCNFCIQ